MKVSLTCYVSSSKPFNVTWLKDGHQVLSSNSVTVHDVRVPFRYNALFFKPVSTTHAGNYTCIAVSSEGTKPTSKEIIVYGKNF